MMHGAHQGLLQCSHILIYISTQVLTGGTHWDSPSLDSLTLGMSPIYLWGQGRALGVTVEHLHSLCDDGVPRDVCQLDLTWCWSL